MSFRNTIHRDASRPPRGECSICGSPCRPGVPLCWECHLDEQVTYTRPLETLRKQDARRDTRRNPGNAPDGE